MTSCVCYQRIGSRSSARWDTASKYTLADVKLEPRGEGRLELIFHDRSSYDIGSRPSVLKELREYIASAYQVDVELSASLIAQEEYVAKIM